MEQQELAAAIDRQVPHLWMVRTFLKHADESEDDDDLREVVRDVYDFILALGPLDESTDLQKYIKQSLRKIRSLRRACDLYNEIQPEVSGHTNFEMAARSLKLSTDRIEELLQAYKQSLK
ncbi:MAG: amidohydrolase [Planctomycetota bacterium]